MKIIHCADLHLDAKMESNLTKEQAKLRKTELIETFCSMIDYAERESVETIMIAGDLFDKKRVPAKLSNIVREQILAHPGITFLYLKGNHDSSMDDMIMDSQSTVMSAEFLEANEEIPENLKLFTRKWQHYRFGNIVISGVELSDEPQPHIFRSLLLEPDDINIVMMHGQETMGPAPAGADDIPIRLLKDKNIDYLALGHIHSFRQATLDHRGIYCYSGCLEGRGFDECGEKGFVLLDVTDNVKSVFVPFAKRVCHECEVMIDGCQNTTQMTAKIAEQLADIRKEDLVKVILKGMIEMDVLKDPEYLKKRFEDFYFCFKLVDQTKVNIDPSVYEHDISLKGEFIRTVMKAKIPEEKKRKIIMCGIQALAGEDL
ncbi:MAG: DNA repair exonuclease [Clostridia bacterium]|nr:DNA repair exonuclease [Clostridia bacterium]